MYQLVSGSPMNQNLFYFFYLSKSFYL